MFCLNHKSYRHSPPLMKRTFEALRKWMEKNKTVEVVPGRDVKYSVPFVSAAGVDMLQATMPSKGGMTAQDDDRGDVDDDVDADVDEDEDGGDIEVEDDGDLEI